MEVLMKFLSLIFLALGFSLTSQAAVEPMKFKTLNELRARAEYYVTCSGSFNSTQVHVMFHVNPVYIGVPVTIQNAGIAIVSPSEGMMIHEWDTRSLQVDASTVGFLKFQGTSEMTHNDYISVVIKDATNGRFRGKLDFRDRATGTAVTTDVVCGGTNYAIPKAN